MAALAVVSGIGALNGWTLVTTEVARAAANDGLFPRAFAWADRKDTAWFGIVMAALLPSLLMLWAYTTKTGLTVFTDLVDLTVVTVAIPYLFSACAQLAYLVSKRRRVQGWPLARDLSIAGAGVLFSMWVTFAAGYQSVYQALILVLAGVVLYAFLKARRENLGQVLARRQAPADDGEPHPPPAVMSRTETEMTFNVASEVGQLRQVIVHRPGLELSRLTPRNVGELLFDDVMWAKKAKEEHDAFAEALRDKGVRVHYFGQLLGETLELPEGRAFVLDRICTPELLGPNLVQPLRSSSRTSTARRWPSSWSAGCSRRTCIRPGRTACSGTCCGPTTSCCRRCPTTCSSGTTRAGSTGACRSTRWPSPPASARRCTAAPSTVSTRCSPPRTSPGTTATTTPATCPPPSRAATCTCSGTAR